MSVNGDEIVEPTTAEPTTETSSGETTEETVEQLEDRLIIALERNEHLEQRLVDCERRLSEVESHRSISEPRNPETTNGTLDTTHDRKPDTPPRTPYFWFRKWGE